MKFLFLAPMIALLSVSSALANIQPVPGSITYDNPDARLTKAPVGSTFFHTFADKNGGKVREVYRVNEDRSLTIVHRALSTSS